MMKAAVKNVIFDVGNVFVRWSPPDVIARCFGISPDLDANRSRVQEIFGSPIWKAINRGELTQSEAESAYRERHGLSPQDTKNLFFHVMDHQSTVEGTEALAIRLKVAGYRLFGLTDNVREIVDHSKAKHSFWSLFEGVIVSAEIGILKPDSAIFRHLLNTFDLCAPECVFFDDIARNVEGAKHVGMHARIFTSAAAAARDLNAIGLRF